MPEARLERADRHSEGRQFPLQSGLSYSDTELPLRVDSTHPPAVTPDIRGYGAPNVRETTWRRLTDVHTRLSAMADDLSLALKV
ncbi:hypothetical protein PTE30175_03513 [Pandoraea terrae]|uniref:Uncharacterized protein n=1 Tax=Pandoraea terrae TaxID=1537710 RepID=A0A5E4X1K7_9BURK|nr:hypothetical protein PTE30175_03513 [Pandoraea terrae]